MEDDRIADATITKVDEDKRLVFGWASIIKDEVGKVLLDRQDDYIDDESELEKAAYSYVLNSRDGGEMHIRKGVSTMVESVVLTKEKQEALGIPAGTLPIGWWIGFRVNDDRVWDEVKKGGYIGFSVHGSGRREQNVLNPAEITEVEKRALTAAEEDALRQHSANYTGKHMRIMRGYMQDGLTLEEAHERASKEVGKDDDCGCGCGGDCAEPVVKVGVRLVSLMAKAAKAKRDKVATVMREFDAGTLKTPDGKRVTSRRQALAIALSEQRRMDKGGDYYGHPFRGNQFSGNGGTGRAGGVGSRRPVNIRRKES